ncbi:MAG: asparagine synthase (glutamine-hydrolyzing) [Caldilineales bacterium]|nr:asparagine synthase (glutamine-hydrolyzing) [Caldilineales bacterium]
MCGITGIYNPNLNPDLAPALAAMFHRGPDDEGRWSDERMMLGARRLAIIDVAGGHQPVCNEDGRVAAVQNGEIYNYVELMAELEHLGHRFQSRCDTEVIVHAWEEWGAGCVERFRGMFALAVYDTRTQSLFLARDRFGIKPLYIARAGETIAFASELPALLRLLDARPAIDTRPLVHLLRFGWVPGPGTLYKGVEQIPPGHRLLAGPDTFALERYWRPQPPPAADLIRPGDRTEKLLALLQESVELRLRSDVPVGALLSGGLDSSTLVALMRRAGHPDLHTFNIGFDDSAYDETAFAERVADSLGVTHHTVRFGLDAFDRLPELVPNYGQPVGSATHIAIWLLYRACAEAGLKVILTGEGADELFGGYQWYGGEMRLQSAQRWPGWSRRLAAQMAGPLGMSAAAAELLPQTGLSLAERYGRWLSPNSTTDVLSLVAPDLRGGVDSSLPWPDPPADLHLLHRLTLLDVQSRLPDFINLEVDRMSMAHSVEARVPFLDHRLWQTVLTWDPSLNLAGGSEKDMLRQAAKTLLPDSIIQRRKQGLASPHARWWRQERLPDWATDMLQPNSLAASGFFDAAAVCDLLQSHCSGRVNNATALTAILTTQLWLDSYHHFPHGSY